MDFPTQLKFTVLFVAEMFTARSFYGFGKWPVIPPPDCHVLIQVPNDGVESDDPKWVGGDDGNLTSSSSLSDDGKQK